MSAAAPGAAAGEKEHVSDAILVTGGVFAQHKDGPLRTVTNDTYARPEIDGAADAVTPWWDKNDAFPFAGLQLVDCCLNGCAIVFFAVAMGVEFLCGEVHRRGVIQARGIDRSGEAGRRDEKT